MTIRTLLSDYRSIVEEIVSDVVGFPVAITDEMIKQDFFEANISFDIVVRGRPQHCCFSFNREMTTDYFPETCFHYTCLRFPNEFGCKLREDTGRVCISSSSAGSGWRYVRSRSKKALR